MFDCNLLRHYIWPCDTASTEQPQHVCGEHYYNVSRSDLWAARSSLACCTENDHCSCLVNRHMLLLHLHRLRCCCRVLLFFLMFHFRKHGYSWHTHIMMLRLPSWLLLLVYCFSMMHYCQGPGNLCQSCWWYDKWQEWDFSTSAVLNASFYNVYYQWFGPGVRLHLGMAKNRFLEPSIKKITCKWWTKSWQVQITYKALQAVGSLLSFLFV